MNSGSESRCVHLLAVTGARGWPKQLPRHGCSEGNEEHVHSCPFMCRHQEVWDCLQLPMGRKSLARSRCSSGRLWPVSSSSREDHVHPGDSALLPPTGPLDSQASALRSHICALCLPRFLYHLMFKPPFPRVLGSSWGAAIPGGKKKATDLAKTLPVAVPVPLLVS